MIRFPAKVVAVSVALTLSLAAVAYAQTFKFRTSLTGSTGDPGILMTLVSGSGLAMEVDASGETPGIMVSGEIRTLTYRNEVSRQLQVTNVAVSPPSPNFQIMSDGCTGTVAVGAQCSVTVQFSAEQDGNYTGTLNIQAQ
jgi:hypothetical protein